MSYSFCIVSASSKSRISASYKDGPSTSSCTGIDGVKRLLPTGVWFILKFSATRCTLLDAEPLAKLNEWLFDAVDEPAAMQCAVMAGE